MVEIQAEKKNEGMNQKSKNKFLSLFWLLTIGYLLLVANAELAFAAFNPQINYQGKLTTPLNVAVSDGTYHMRFYIYNTTGGATTSAIWTEDRSTAAGDRITVTNGLFSVMLGSSTPLTGVNFDQTLYLGIEVGGSSATPTWDGEMSPRKILGAVPAAFVAQNLNGGSATTTNLLVTSSTTLQNFTFQNATGTAATTTNLFSTNATFTNLFGTNSRLTLGIKDRKETKATLEGTVKELEKLNKTMFGREERILELKEEIKSLKEKLQVKSLEGGANENN